MEGWKGHVKSRTLTSVSSWPALRHMRDVVRFMAPGAVLALSGCASAPASTPAPEFIVPRDANLVESVESVPGTMPLRALIIENRSSMEISVYSVMLTACRNVKQRCDTPLGQNVRVAPGARSVVFRVEPQDRDAPFDYRVAYRWRPTQEAMAAHAHAFSAGIIELHDDGRRWRRMEDSLRAAGIARADAEPEADIAALGSRIVTLSVEPNSITLREGETVTLDRFRVLAVGEHREQLGRVRRLRWRIPLHLLALTPPDSVQALRAGRAVVEVFVLPDTTNLRVIPRASGLLEINIRK
jgi:hypothetical protein